MKARVDSEAHRKTQELLPWFVNGTLRKIERAEVAGHLKQCTRCTADAAEIRTIRFLGGVAASQTPSVGGQHCYGGLARTPSRRSSVGRCSLLRWLQIAVLLQVAVILVLARALLWAAPRSEPYRTLGAASSAAQANAVVVFELGATQAQMASALRAAGAYVVAGGCERCRSPLVAVTVRRTGTAHERLSFAGKCGLSDDTAARDPQPAAREWREAPLRRQGRGAS